MKRHRGHYPRKTSSLMVSWDKEGLFSHGKRLSDSASVCLVAEARTRYVFTDLPEPGGQIIFIDPVRRSLVITASRHGQYPLFFHSSPGIILVHHSPWEIRAHLEERGGVEADTTAVLEALTLDTPLRHRTLFMGISKALPGEELVLDLDGDTVKRSVRWVPSFDLPDLEREDEAKLVSKAKAILDGLLSPHMDRLRGRRVLMPLSGGLDSRLLLCLLKKNGIETQPLVFGPPRSNDVRVARTVADRMGLDLLYVPLEDQDYPRFGRDVTVRSGGMTNPMHCHLFATLSKLDKMWDVIVHGFLGGEYAGECQRTETPEAAKGRQEALWRCVRHIPGKNPLWHRLDQCQRDAVLQDMEQVMNDCLMENAPFRFEEFLRCVDRQSLVANSCTLIEQWGPVLYPFANDRYADFFCGLPPGLRAGRRLFRQACLELFGDVFQLPDHNEVGVTGRPSPYHKLRKRLLLLAHYASFHLSGGRLALDVPYVFERHLQVLNGPYREEMKRGAAVTGRLIGMDLSDFARFGFLAPARVSTRFWMIAMGFVFSGKG